MRPRAHAAPGRAGCGPPRPGPPLRPLIPRRARAPCSPPPAFVAASVRPLYASRGSWLASARGAAPGTLWTRSGLFFALGVHLRLSAVPARSAWALPERSPWEVAEGVGTPAPSSPENYAFFAPRSARKPAESSNLRQLVGLGLGFILFFSLHSFTPPP